MYKRRKENDLCVECGKKLDRAGALCSECLKKRSEYSRKNREFFKKNHLCTYCGKERVFGEDKTCFECRAKRSKYRAKTTEEQKRKAKEYKNKLYKERRERGICTDCGKRKPMPRKTRCGICLETRAEWQRKARARKNKPSAREYREVNHLCYFCGNPIDMDTGRICSVCRERCRQNGIKSGGGNDYWRQDNKIAFLKK